LRTGEERAVAEEPESGIRETLYKQPATREQVEATEIDRTGVRDVTAGTVVVKRSNAQSITAERLTMERSAAKSVDAKSLQMDRSAAARLNSERVVLQGSTASQISTRELRMVRSQAGFVMAQSAHLEESRVLVLAGHAEGDVHTVLTARSAAVLGAAFGAGAAMIVALIRLANRRG
jgi:hypothetical protein